MLDEILAELRNYFVRDVRCGKFEVIGGRLSPSDFLQNGQYFRIVGSVMNDGVYRYPHTGLIDETFSGEIWALALPPALIALVADIEEFEKKQTVSPYTSESFGGYSYTKATDTNGTPISWQTAFAKRLNKWRKI